MNFIFNRYVLGMVAILILAALAFASGMYHTFFIYVPPGQMLIIHAKTGTDLPGGEMVATKPGQKGILLEVYGEGRHFVMPYFYERELQPLIKIPPNKVGVVTALVGDEPPAGAMLVDENQKGLRRRVLTPGKYRLNPHAFRIEECPAIEVPAGYVGFVTSLVGTPPKGRFASDGEKGIMEKVLQPGLYYLNPYEYKVEKVEIGISQVTFADATAIRFPSKDAFDIAIEATVEWELLPKNVALVMAEFGGKDAIEQKVIVPQSRSIGRLQGSSYSAKEFLLGKEREKFQSSFTAELEKTCESKHLDIHSAFIRNLTIPDNLLKPIREAFIAIEMEKTAKVWEETQKSKSDLEREQALIAQRRTEVKAQTDAITKTIEAETQQEVGNIEANTQLEVAQKEQEIATIEAQKTIALGEAKASVTRLEGEASSKAMEAKVKAFGDDAPAFVNYSFAKKLPKNLRLKLIYSGSGTLWTDLKGTAGLGDLGGVKILQGASETVAPSGEGTLSPAPAPQP